MYLSEHFLLSPLARLPFLVPKLQTNDSSQSLGIISQRHCKSIMIFFTFDIVEEIFPLMNY